MKKLPSLTSYSPQARDVLWTIPNVISLLRIFSIPFIALFIARHQMIIALVILAISSFSDALDGFIARACNQVSKIGQILDPIADRLLIFCSVLALGIAGIIPLWILLVVFIRDCLLALLILVLAQHDYGPLPVHFVGKTGTALIMTSIVLFIFSNIQHMLFFFHFLSYCAVSAGIWGILLYWLAGVIYFRQGLTILHKHHKNNIFPHQCHHESDINAESGVTHA